MEHTSHEFLRQLLETPSPSGFEQPIQQVVRDWVRPFADEVHTDRHGNATLMVRLARKHTYRITATHKGCNRAVRTIRGR